MAHGNFVPPDLTLQLLLLGMCRAVPRRSFRLCPPVKTFRLARLQSASPPQLFQAGILMSSQARKLLAESEAGTVNARCQVVLSQVL